MNRRAVSFWILIFLMILSFSAPGLNGDSSSGSIGMGLAGLESEGQWLEETIFGSGLNKVVRLDFNGVITSASDQFGRSTYSNWKSQLEQAREDSSVKAIVIAVDSPGGEVNASDELHDLIKQTQDDYGIPVVISMQSTAASGGYYISAPAKQIFALPGTITGSLGVIFSVSNYRKAADWIGYDEIVIKSGKMKDIGNPLREMTEEERAVFQSLIDESYAEFVRIIAEGRKMSEDAVRKIADGRIYSGLQAEKNGLVDQTGSLEDATSFAVKEFAGGNARVVSYTPTFTLIEQILYGAGVSVDGLNQAVATMNRMMKTGPELLYLYQP